MLNNSGLKISKISKLSDEDLSLEVQRIGESETEYPIQIDRLIVAMVDLDRSKFETILADCIETMGFEDTCINVLYPLLQKIGVMWLANSINPAQEHFISSLIIQKMYSAIDNLYTEGPKGRKVIFFLREGELHEMGLLFFRYLMEKRGFDTIYLGQSVPFEDLKQTVEAHKPDFLVTALVASPEDDFMEKYLKQLANSFKNTKIIASGYQISQFDKKLPKNIIKVDDVNQFIKYLDSNK
jgi:methanogenic corrinoid protein MtbC1